MFTSSWQGVYKHITKLARSMNVGLVNACYELTGVDLHRSTRDSQTLNEKFVDEYITCHLPTTEEDEELKDILEHVQIHSKKHSKSCKKGRQECRGLARRQS